MNSTNSSPPPVPFNFESDRFKRWQSELRYAWSQLSRNDVLVWGAACGFDFAGAATRRVKNLAHFAKSSVLFVGKETMSGYAAWSDNRLAIHLQSRASDAVDSVRRVSRAVNDFASQFSRSFQTDPADAGVHLLTLVLTSLVVSGGPDGNGGAPDLDLMAGIDAHRSILSHSILMGAALEAGILSLLGVVKMTHSKLPSQHDELWDSLFDQAKRMNVTASMGVGIGMAYHLLVDGLVQPAPYHGLPMSMPIEAHQTLFVANGVGEAINISKKGRG